MNVTRPLDIAGEVIAATLAELLQDKHLYQSRRVDMDMIVARIRKESSTRKIPGLIPSNFTGGQVTTEYPVSEVIEQLGRILKAEWSVYVPADRGHRYLPDMAGRKPGIPPIRCGVPDVHLMCSRCERREAFNVMNAVDAIPQHAYDSKARHDDVCQQFVLVYQCQACKASPEVFLVRRQQLKLTLCGRGPIEMVTAPTIVPGTVVSFYRDALLAHQSGQTLAALFLLRTVIEQWVYSLDPGTERYADVALDWYMEQLPPDFKARFPSLRELYSELSDNLHRATGSAEVFDRTTELLMKHFKARGLFEL